VGLILLEALHQLPHAGQVGIFACIANDPSITIFFDQKRRCVGFDENFRNRVQVKIRLPFPFYLLHSGKDFLPLLPF
jgi:hypothetical protein